MLDKIRVLIVDDHAILREGIRALLALQKDIEVIGEAGDGQEAIEQVRKLKPDVVLMDIAMPRLGGLEATTEITRGQTKTKVLVLTQYDSKEYILRFLKAGAAGYILKKALGTELAAAIRTVHEGGSFLYPSIAREVIAEYVRTCREKGVESLYDTLTDREKEILKLIAEGHTNKEIAELLFISVKTVIGHRTNIMEKLNIHSSTELVKFAIREGIVDVGT
jgi:DNA-binding NarL/FixJ family response regulator